MRRLVPIKLALVSGIAKGVYQEHDVIVALLARRPASMPDSILVVTVGAEDEEGAFSFLQAEGVSAELVRGDEAPLGGHGRIVERLRQQRAHVAGRLLELTSLALLFENLLLAPELELEERVADLEH